MSEQIKPEESLRAKVERKLVEDGAQRRAELWRAMGFATSKPHMPQHEYDRDYVGRIWFCNEQVMDQAQQALRIILCPGCLKEDKRGGISATRFYVTVEDDVMTTFPAVGHFLCYHCGFEEWQPLSHDPRVHAQQQQAIDAAMMNQLQNAQNRLAQQQNDRMANQARYNQLADALGRGVVGLPGMGIGGTSSEEAALRRLYEQHMQKERARAIANPPIMNPILGKKINKIP